MQVVCFFPINKFSGIFIQIQEKQINGKLLNHLDHDNYKPRFWVVLVTDGKGKQWKKLGQMKAHKSALTLKKDWCITLWPEVPVAALSVTWMLDCDRFASILCFSFSCGCICIFWCNHASNFPLVLHCFVSSPRRWGDLFLLWTFCF